MPSGGKIILCGESYTFEKNYSFPKSDKKYTLTSETSGDVVFSGCLNLNSDFLIENVTFSGSLNGSSATVISQNPAAGTVVSRGAIVEVNLRHLDMTD